MKSTETSPSAHVLKKLQPEEFDLVILGGGTGSTIAAWTFAGEGKRVAVVDRKYIGGSCPNIACLPSKNIIHSAKVVDYFRRSKDFGIAIGKDGFTIEMAGVRERKRKMVVGLNEIYGELPEDGRRVHFGRRAVRCSENCGSHPGLWDHTSITQRECDRQHRHTGLIGTNSWPC
jgi:hypothetical protein